MKRERRPARNAAANITRSTVARERDVRDDGEHDEPVAIGFLAACFFAQLAERAARAGNVEAAKKLAEVAATAAAAVAGVDGERAA